MHLASAVFVLSLVLGFSLLASGQGPSPLDVEKQITTTLHQMYEAEKRKDLDFVLAHLAPDFAEVAGDGRIYHREDIEREWSNVSLHAYTLSDCIFKQLASDVAYLSCQMSVDAVYKGQPFPGLFRVTTVWTRSNDGWAIRFEQGTVIPDEKK